MLLSGFIRSSVASLGNLYPEEEARAIVARLCEERLGVKSYTHIVEPSTELPQALVPLLEKDMDRLSKAEPLQYVLGYEWFCGNKFQVNGSVLIPRPETEALVQKTLGFLSGNCSEESPKVLDLCTGSGCIAWSVAAACPSAEVVGVDISETALSLAITQNLECRRAPRFLTADVLAAIPEAIDEEYDVIVSNPPYVKSSERSSMRPNVLEYEPGLALFVSDENPLVFYDSVAEWGSRLLRKGGAGFVEINENLSHETVELFESHGFVEVAVEDDFRGRPRYVNFRRK